MKSALNRHPNLFHPRPRLRTGVLLALALAATIVPAGAAALSTGFYYQGVVLTNDDAATGIFDFEFRLYDASAGGNPVGATLAAPGLGVDQGLLTTTLDFGPGAFQGDRRWLQIGLRPAGSGSAFQTLNPRQDLAATPYALHALTAGQAQQASSAATVAWTGLTGIPAGLADGVDQDTTYSAGSGLTLTGTQFAVANGGIGAPQLAASAVGTLQVQDATLLPADLNLGAFGTTFWGLSGNLGTLPASQFVGTRDNQPLEFRVNLGRALRIEPASKAPNLIGGSPVNQVTSDVSGAIIAGGGAADLLGAPHPNRISADFGTIIGGVGNTVEDTAPFGTVLGGAENAVNAPWGTAAGYRSKVHHTGAFVWADSQDADFGSVADNEFALRAAGGLRLDSPRGVVLNPADQPMITRGWNPFTSGPNAGIGRWGMFMENSYLVLGLPAVQGRFFQVASYLEDGSRVGLATIDQVGNLDISGALREGSDRHSKENITGADPAGILQKVLTLPISEWSYRGDESTRHLGPMAQDFHAAFGLGTDDRSIAPIDTGGVALAAIQGLHALVHEKDQELAALEGRNRLLEERLARLEALLGQQESVQASGGIE